MYQDINKDLGNIVTYKNYLITYKMIQLILKCRTTYLDTGICIHESKVGEFDRECGKWYKFFTTFIFLHKNVLTYSFCYLLEEGHKMVQWVKVFTTKSDKTRVQSPEPTQ